MTTVLKQIQNTDYVISQNITLLTDQRSILSQNILSQLRNLVEAVAVLVHTQSSNTLFNYHVVEPSLNFTKSKAKYNFLGKFHKLIQISSSHYTLDGDSSERLMLKYYEYLYRIRNLLSQNYNISILNNLELFPIDLDPSLREYHEKIAKRINQIRSTPVENTNRDRYYIHKIRPFYTNGSIYYEVTFYRAINKVNKFDRIIAFTDIDISDKYSSNLWLQQDSIEVLNQKMPIIIIRYWEVSIRPCEFINYAKILGINSNIKTISIEYRYLMQFLTERSNTLLDLIDMYESNYLLIKQEATQGDQNNQQIFTILDKVRHLNSNKSAGYNILRYLIFRMNNQILKLQYYSAGCNRLSDLRISYGCIPFEQMPFCTSLLGHNPKHIDLIESIDPIDRSKEFLARYIKNNVEHHGIIYTPLKEIEKFGNIQNLINIYNKTLYFKHRPDRELVLDKGHIFISQYENDTFNIIKKLQNYSTSGIDGYSHAVNLWLKNTSLIIDDPIKIEALKLLFSKSRIALIYGAAGTGKSTMVDHIARYFNEKNKLFLAHTNPAIDNLKRKINAQNSEFRTITSHISKSTINTEYDLLIVDECSTVSNIDILKILEKTSFKLLVFVGDIYQIESIQFGNWFNIIRSFIPSTSIFELTTPYRTNNQSILNFWNKVRNLEDDIAEVMARNNYSTVLDKTLFEAQNHDEIILCLNYDGLYGINNINRFLQSSNKGKAVTWRVSTYKVGDPILFSDTERFRPVIYNNLKGWIIDIIRTSDGIQFDIEIDRPLDRFDVIGTELEWVRDSIIRFSVYDIDTSDDDIDILHTTVPFQVAYAVSIHKAQGLEYSSVKIVITDANEDEVTHSIFYTAITRAREQLKVFWTPETQQNVLKKLTRNTNMKDVALLSKRRDLLPFKT